MAVIRIKKTKDYTVMSNYHLKDLRISLKAVGLLSKMLSLPDNWDYTVSGLVGICKENETAINNILKELKEFGYLVVTKKMPNETESGRIEYEYDIFERPQKQEGKKQDLENLGVEFLGVEFLGVENQGQLNTNNRILNIKEKEKDKKEKNKETNKKINKFIIPALDDVIEYMFMELKSSKEEANNFYDYYESVGWTVGKNKTMKDWKAAARRWLRNKQEWNKQSNKLPDFENPHNKEKVSEYIEDYYNKL